MFNFQKWAWLCLLIHLVCWLNSYVIKVCFFSCRYQEKVYINWSQTVSEKSQYNLTQPLIRREPETKLLTVNFDPQVKTTASYLSCLSAGIPSCWAFFFFHLTGLHYRKVIGWIWY